MPVDALSVGLRALSFLAMFQGAGMALFLALFARHLQNTEPGLRRVGLSSTLLAMVLVVAHYALESARISGEFAGVLNERYQGMVLHSSFSIALVIRLVGLVLVFTGLRIRVRPMGVLGAIAIAASFVVTGHTASHTDRWALAFALVIHVLAAVFWFGSLMPLRRITLREPLAVAGKLVAAFSLVATWIVPALFVAGLTLAVTLVPSVDALFNTTYGQLVLVKTVGFALLMLLAGLNKWRYTPALERGDTWAIRSFRGSILVEFALLAGILCLTATLTTFYSPND